MFEFEPGLIIWTSISFGILILFFYKLLLPPLLDIIDKRERQISSSLEEAHKTKKEAAELFSDYKQKIEVAHINARQIIDNAKVESQIIVKKALDAAKLETKDILNQAKLEIGALRGEMIKEVKEASADLIVSVAGKVLGREVSIEDNVNIIRETLNES
ncbi:ATP synthase F0 subunit B [candidate division WOR-1 bacterium RIFOXYA2_FULL_36_21]|uniref:ATP synthase subunit b n=1 Tax=candidate division WOR-1 bacterium RIFOXYB2_FULL_36_35 TaxID=1802578 RepID=A0A1F4RXR8_UNCSA|nr:MAG: ATP synthase F0 subunit B [candidate division WOR-1 bacterium RIFOXYA2_FULL_36_21]OGC12964.1 MAG: ATP synthase F0 subunit B [candidate division WOR-1 bacterium RIFOXYB2_FULL_36_35]OGC19988.1 MAG: ATP synthase F0 subunit B [candidate division WOR-1 bacterium RIFOXYA12_FULL_36_13]